MELQQLLERVQQLQPGVDAIAHSRTLLMLTIVEPRLSRFQDESYLQRQFQSIQLRLQAATDQHAAVADELDELASSNPCDFSPKHVWTLIRAIKVQSRILDMYLDPIDSTATTPTDP
jgi:hypothetical protein